MSSDLTFITNESGKSPNDAYILKRLKDKAVRRCQQFTEDDEEFVGKVIRLVEDGSLPKATAKKIAAA